MKGCVTLFALFRKRVRIVPRKESGLSSECLIKGKIFTPIYTQNRVAVVSSTSSNKQEACQILDCKFGASHGLSIQYNNERFPGLFVKFERNLKKVGTAIVFHSGKIVIVGCKGLDELKCLSQAVSALISIK